MNELVVLLGGVVRVFNRTEATEAHRIKPRTQRFIARNEHVKADVELPIANEQWLIDVTRDNEPLLALLTMLLAC